MQKYDTVATLRSYRNVTSCHFHNTNYIQSDIHLEFMVAATRVHTQHFDRQSQLYSFSHIVEKKCSVQIAGLYI